MSLEDNEASAQVAPDLTEITLFLATKRTVYNEALFFFESPDPKKSSGIRWFWAPRDTVNDRMMGEAFSQGRSIRLFAGRAVKHNQLDGDVAQVLASEIVWSR